MTHFLIRIELHAATKEDYNILHSAMQRLGFSRTIKGDDGKTYQLPTAEYHILGNYALGSLIEQSKRAAESTDKKFEILGAECSYIRWDYLPLA